jgi:hypothetical protein
MNGHPIHLAKETMDFCAEETPIRTSIHYVEEPKVDKLYHIHGDIGNVIPQTNTVNDPQIVEVHNARSIQLPAENMFHMYGFATMALQCSLPPRDYFDPERVERVLYPECKSIVGSLFPNAVRIEVLEHNVCQVYSSACLSSGQVTRNLGTKGSA